MSIEGIYFDGATSRGFPATAEIDFAGYFCLRYEGGERRVALDSLRISSRVGNTPRTVRFDDGASFETGDNDMLDEVLKKSGGPGGLAHSLESGLRYVVVAVVLVIVAGWGMVRYGIPWLADNLADKLPAATTRYIAEQTVEALDKRFFEPSRLPDDRQQALQQRFAGMTPGDAGDFEFRLLFRDSKKMGANAFALPSGTILMTDQLVNLSEHDDELVSILAHEIGHVVNRHSMRHIIRNSLWSFLLVWMTGDMSGASVVIASAPVLLIDLRYSREFETEADEYALRYMLDNDIAPERFVNIMERMETAHRSRGESIPEFLSTHPVTKNRLKMFREAVE